MLKSYLSLMGVILIGVSGMVYADTNTTASQPTPTPKIDLHTDWFNLKYDDVRDVTYIKTKDGFGPGESLKNNSEDNIKFSISASFAGKTFDSRTPVIINIAFSRMAGMKQKSKDILFGANGEDLWKPMHGNELFTLNNCEDVLFVLPTNDEVQFKSTKLSYKTVNSSGFMGEQYQWEVLTIKTDLNFLEKLQDGAKASFCETSIQFNKDTISQVRSLIAFMDKLSQGEATK